MGGRDSPGAAMAVEGVTAWLVQEQVSFGTRLGAADPRTERRPHPACLGSILLTGVAKGLGMHYYQFHVSDYIHDTAHLTFVEDIVYRRLLDLYYTSEKPIPDDPQTVARRIRMPKHSDVVEAVLKEFFCCEKDTKSWTHKRCEEGIRAYQDKREINQRNGRLGGRPKHKPGETQSVSDSEPSRNLNHKPITNNHKPIKNNKATDVATPVGVSDDTWEAFKALRRAKKAPITKRALDGIMAEAQKAGWSLDAAMTEMAARGWTGFKAEWVSPREDKKTAGERNKAVLGGLTRGLVGGGHDVKLID